MKSYAKTPTVFQMEATECGAASLSMIFAYWGKYMPLEQMRIETGVSRDGCNAGNIMRAAKKYGFECHGYRREPEQLRSLDMPCLIHWNFNHFVVLEGFKGKYVFINDPAVGRRKLSWEEFDDAFTGIVLTFAPTETFVREKKPHTTAAFIKERLSGQYEVLTKLFVAGFTLVFPGIILPITLQIFMDDVLIGGNTSWFNKLIIFIVATIAFQAALSLYRDLVLVKLQKKMVLTSAREFIDTLFRLPISFFDQRYVGDLTSRVQNNANLSEFFAGELAQTVLNIVIAAFYIVLLIIYSPILTIIAISTVVINALIIKFASNVISNASVKLQQDSGKLSGAVCAGISIADTLKASGTENEYTGRILGYYAKTITTEQRLSRNQQILNAIPDTVKMIADVLTLVVGGMLVIQGQMTIGMLVAFTMLFGSFSEPIDKLAGFVKNIQTMKADMNRVADISNYKGDDAYRDSKRVDMAKTKLDGSVQLCDVSFGYSRLKPPLIRDFSFSIECGSSVAFVGASGCGKSTVTKIVSGLYRPWEGAVLFDGVDTYSIPKEVINASVSTVSQNITLFSGSIRDNLTMWNPCISEVDMVQAAKDACIHDVISQKPGGYDFKLTEGATNMSGGQRQRLEIARALATNPTILVMDEATSALDPVVEKQIIDNIKRRGCTCVIVAHRLSAIRDADLIVVMSNGLIVQSGTHEQLSQEDGYYKELVKNI